MRRTRPIPASIPSNREAALQQLRAQQSHLLSRRQFLIASAGSAALLFANGPPALANSTSTNHWQVLEAAQQILFPSEPDAPGAREINALGYLKFVVSDPYVDHITRKFILDGADWLEGMATQLQGRSFVQLSPEKADQVMQRIAQSRAGENWLSTLLSYVFEALLSDPVYGGNTNGVGWKWLQHTPGFPRPDPQHRYAGLLL